MALTDKCIGLMLPTGTRFRKSDSRGLFIEVASNGKETWKLAYRYKDKHCSKGGDEIYALHAPDVDCISKGKACVRYEFGCKFSVATTIDEDFVFRIRSLPGNPYDGHTKPEALEKVEILTDQRPELIVVDRGYRGHNVRRSQVLISGMTRGLTSAMKTLLRRRSAIEPEIGHMKSDGRLARCPLRGTVGDTIFAVLCGCGHNLRKILAHLRALLLSILGWLVQQANPSSSRQHCVLTL